MVIIMKVNGKITHLMDMENSIGIMETNMKVNLLMEIDMVKVHFTLVMKSHIKVNGKMI